MVRVICRLLRVRYGTRTHHAAPGPRGAAWLGAHAASLLLSHGVQEVLTHGWSLGWGSHHDFTGTHHHAGRDAGPIPPGPLAARLRPAASGLDSTTWFPGQAANSRAVLAPQKGFQPLASARAPCCLDTVSFRGRPHIHSRRPRFRG
jgi:hypothetical protein